MAAAQRRYRSRSGYTLLSARRRRLPLAPLRDLLVQVAHDPRLLLDATDEHALRGWRRRRGAELGVGRDDGGVGAELAFIERPFEIAGAQIDAQRRRGAAGGRQIRGHEAHGQRRIMCPIIVEHGRDGTLRTLLCAEQPRKLREHDSRQEHKYTSPAGRWLLHRRTILSQPRADNSRRYTAFFATLGWRASARRRASRLGRGVVVLDSPTISRHHARITISGDQTIVEDLGSKAGTWVEAPVTKPTALRHGHELRFGSVVVTVRCGGHQVSTEIAARPGPGPRPKR